MGKLNPFHHCSLSSNPWCRTPSESPTGDSNGPFGGMPSSHASLQPGGKSGNSGSLPGQTGATCPSQETTTVFVTVYPTNGAQHSGTGMSGGSGGGHSSPHSIKSAHSVDVSAVLGSLLTVSSVKPFTTVTIDIWGPGSGSNGGSGKGSGSGPSDGSGNGSGPVVSASGSAPAYTAGGGVSGGSNGQISASQPSQTGDSGIHGGNSNGGAASTALAVSQQGPNGASGTAPSYGNGGGSGEKGSAGLPLTTANGGGESRLGPASYTTVTDTDIKWTEGPNGPTQITIVSEQTIPVGGAATSSPANGGSGQGGGQGSGHGPPAYQTGSGFGGHFSTIGPNGQSTVMGPIGLSTDHNGHVPFSSFPLPNGLTPHAPTFASTAAAASLTAGALTTTCISYTIVGSNGLPTIVETTWVIPATAASPVPSTYGHGPLSSQGFAPGNSNEASGALPTGIPSLSVANSGIPPGMGKTTCTSFTTIGPNGLPTIVESTYVIPAAQSTPDFTGGVPGPVVTQDSTALGAGMPASSGAVGGPFRPGITTCVSYTIIGSNGYPTIVESTYVVPGPAKTGSGPPWNTAGAASGGLPPSSPTQFTVPEGSPSQVISGGSVITTETCFTILGPNGKPTVIDTTIIIPTANSPTGIQGSPSGASSAVAVGFSSSMTSGIGQPVVTTKTYFTVLGPNGQPTVTEATIVVPVPSNAQTGIPYLSGPSSNFPSVITAGVPGQGTGQPGYPPQQGALTTCTSYTIIGSDGRPTVVETTWTIPAGNEFPTATSLGLPQESSTGFPGGSAGSPSNAAGNGGVTICTTETIVGPNGLATPVVETIILPTGAGNGFSYSTALAATAGFPPFPKSIPAVDSSSMSLPGTSIPSLSAYGSGNLFPPGGPGLPPIDSGSILGASTAEATFASGTVMGTLTSTYTVVVPNGVSAVSGVSPMPLPAYTGVFGNGEPNPSGPGHFSSLGGGAAPSEETLWPTPKYGATDAPATPSGNAPCPTTSVSIGTWANIIPDETTTYTIDFPFSTLITLRVPKTSPLAKRAFRRQFRYVDPFTVLVGHVHCSTVPHLGATPAPLHRKSFPRTLRWQPVFHLL